MLSLGGKSFFRVHLKTAMAIGFGISIHSTKYKKPNPHFHELIA